MIGIQLAILYIINNKIKFRRGKYLQLIRPNPENITIFVALNMLTSKYLWVKY
jgi:hypothetical protein